MMSNMAVLPGSQFGSIKHPWERQSRAESPTGLPSATPREREQSNPEEPLHVHTISAIDRNKAWQQVLARDRSAHFFYAVSSTGIFCRASCPSRRPARRNVAFFPSAAHALAAGFRACLRCQPVGLPAEASMVATICEHLKTNFDRKVTLAELARVVGASPFTVQRMVQRVLGVSPLDYQRELRAASLRDGLTPGTARGQTPAATVTSAIYDAGYSSPSGVYGESRLGMSPGKYRGRGLGESIRFATAPCELGVVLVAETRRGICAIFLGDDPATLEAELRGRFPSAQVAADMSPESGPSRGSLAIALAQVLSQMTEHPVAIDLPADVKATAFQTRVWHALKAIPRGETRSYAEIARELGRPTAVRAVARACASNSVALLIPCHRVIASDGKLTGYRWGVGRKRRLLELERKPI
jgi:AraC family transcriptional regulator of adaptative response/methylated-DNA-[protein]-cysteine methyltransferase